MRDDAKETGSIQAAQSLGPLASLFSPFTYSILLHRQTTITIQKNPEVLHVKGENKLPDVPNDRDPVYTVPVKLWIRNESVTDQPLVYTTFLRRGCLHCSCYSVTL